MVLDQRPHLALMKGSDNFWNWCLGRRIQAACQRWLTASQRACLGKSVAWDLQGSITPFIYWLCLWTALSARWYNPPWCSKPTADSFHSWMKAPGNNIKKLKKLIIQMTRNDLALRPAICHYLWAATVLNYGKDWQQTYIQRFIQLPAWATSTSFNSLVHKTRMKLLKGSGTEAWLGMDWWCDVFSLRRPLQQQPNVCIKCQHSSLTMQRWQSVSRLNEHPNV